MDLEHRLEGRFIKPKVARYFEPADPPPFIDFETAARVNMYALAETFKQTLAGFSNGAPYLCKPAYLPKPNERLTFAQVRMASPKHPLGFILETRHVFIEGVNKDEFGDFPAILEHACEWQGRSFSLYPTYGTERDRRDPDLFEYARAVLARFLEAHVLDGKGLGPDSKKEGRGAWQRLPKTNPSP